MTNLVLIFAGGGLGAVCRHLVGAATLRHFGTGFPYGTLIVNIAGSLLMGLLIGWLVTRSASSGTGQGTRLLLATGFLGGFTTFSAFSLDAINLWERGEVTQTMVYVVSSVVISIAAVFVGLLFMRSVTA